MITALNYQVTQHNLQPTTYRFTIPHDNTNNDTVLSKVSKITNFYKYWFSRNFYFFHLQFNFLKPNKHDMIHLPKTHQQYPNILRTKRSHQFTYETFYHHHAQHSPENHHLFLNDKYSSDRKSVV